MREMYPAEKGPLSDVPNSGPAPVLMRWKELFKVAACLLPQPSPHARSMLQISGCGQSRGRQA